MRRPGPVAFALVVYAASVATSLYAFGFVGNYWSLVGLRSDVWRSLDVGPRVPLVEALVVDLALIALFGVQHSAMARRSFKAWSARVVPASVERSVYVLAATLCLVLLFAGWRPIGAVVYDVSGGPLGFALVAGSLAGWAIVVCATFLIDHAELFGLRQALGGSDSAASGAELVTPGLYRAVRHPLYFGFLVAFWATPVMTLGHALFAVGLTVYVLIAIPLEERDLVARFGERYVAYRKRVRALLPFPRRAP